MPLMADGELLTLGREPSREREKDEERKRVKEQEKKTKMIEQRRATNNPDLKKKIQYSEDRKKKFLLL